MQKNLSDRLYQQKYVSFILKEVKQFFTDLFTKTANKLESNVYSVVVENTESELLKETAVNTRKSASRLQELLLKEVPEFPKRMEVTVLNPQKIEFPAIPKPLSTVSISNLNEIKFPEQKNEVIITNLKDFPVPKPPTIEKVDISSLEKLLKDVKSALFSINEQLPDLKSEKVVIPSFPKPEKFPNTISLKESEAVLEQLQDVNENLVELHKAISDLEVGNGGTGGSVSVSAPAVTSVSVNALRGLSKSTAVTVTNTATPLPAIPLEYRKSLIVFNNSSNVIYLGGSNVTTNNGLPIAVGTYSPSIDAGDQLKVYAIAASGSNDVRVYEVSSEKEGA